MDRFMHSYFTSQFAINNIIVVADPLRSHTQSYTQQMIDSSDDDEDNGEGPIVSSCFPFNDTESTLHKLQQSNQCYENDILPIIRSVTNDLSTMAVHGGSIRRSSLSSYSYRKVNRRQYLKPCRWGDSSNNVVTTAMSPNLFDTLSYGNMDSTTKTVTAPKKKKDVSPSHPRQR